MNGININQIGLIPELQLNDISFEEGNIPEYVKSINSPLSSNAELTFECYVDPRLFGARMGIDLSRFSDMSGFTIEFKTPYQVQIRRHKKKRINKKWAKRYGHKTVFKNVNLTDVHFDPSYEIREDGTIRFTEISLDGKLSR